ncbi:MAG TPA: hypothetical protein PLB55_04515, partial [Prosthecobacter sp.]|nr:hypothetical protein [Prosthecobacter sp.]
MKVRPGIHNARDAVTGVFQLGVLDQLTTRLLHGRHDRACTVNGDPAIFVTMEHPEWDGFQSFRVLDF